MPESLVGTLKASASRTRAQMSVAQKLRVMHVVLNLEPGGTERLVIEICRRLLPVVDSSICCLDTSGVWVDEVTAAGIPVHVLHRKPGLRPSIAYRIAELVDRHDVEAIHCHHYSPYVYGAVATLLRRHVGLVFTEHGRLAGATASRKRRLANWWLTRIPGEIYAVSGDLKRHMLADGFPDHRVQVIYNGIAVGDRPDENLRSWARQTLGVDDDAFLIGTVGRLDPVKNLGMLLDAHASVVRSVPRARLAIVGGGSEQAALERQSRELGISDIVRFTGYRKDARQLMAGFDVYVNCSDYEGVSLTILEAMAAGLPTVVTRVGGNTEVVTTDVTGISVPARSAASLTAAIIELFHDPARRQTFGKAARERIIQDFSIDRMVTNYLRAYERLSGGRRNQMFSANSYSAR